MKEKQVSEDLIRNALISDQCWFGIKHTNHSICLWMCGNTREGRKDLLKQLKETDEELERLKR